MTQPSNVRFVMEDRLIQDLDNLQTAIDADQSAFEDSVNNKLYGASSQNFIINGAMDVWQRGTGNFTGTGYCADRWKIDSNTSFTVSRYDSSFTYYGTNGDYSMSLFATTGTNAIQVSQCFESNYVNALRGQSVTLSYTARCFNGTSPSVSANVDISGSPNTSLGTFTPVSTSFVSTIGTTWARYSETYIIPFDDTSDGLRVRFNIDNATSGEIIYITDVKLERGTNSSPFTRAGGNLAGELAACQRYYYRIWPDTVSARYGVGQAISTTSGQHNIDFPVTMRVRPTALEQSGTAAHYQIVNSAGTAVALSAVPTFTQSTVKNATVTGASTYTAAGNATQLISANILGYLGFSAEL